MIERRVLEPEKTYLFTKEIIATNQMFPGNKRKWAIEMGRENLSRFLLPIGHIMSFTVVRNKLLFVIKIHPEEVLRKVPKFVKDQAFRLEVKTLDQYIRGELQNIALPQTQTYELTDLAVAIRKRFANFLQSFTIRYNKQYNRRDRLSARPTGIYEIQGDEDLKQILLEIQNTPLIHGDNRDLDKCETNSFHLDRKDVRKVVSWQRVVDLFNGEMQNFQSEVKSTRSKLMRMLKNFEYLREVPPGWYLGRQ